MRNIPSRNNLGIGPCLAPHSRRSRWGPSVIWDMLGSMGTAFTACAAAWWRVVSQPAEAPPVILGAAAPPGFIRFLLFLTILAYAVYGASMGLFVGWIPASVSALKFPLLYLATLAICIVPLYTANCVFGVALRFRALVRLLLMMLSANGVVIASYVPVSYFFVFTSSIDAYSFLIVMHVGVLVLSAGASLAVNVMIIRAVARETGQSVRPGVVAFWAGLYAVVGAHTAWTLRPWIGNPDEAYQAFRPIGGSFLESLLQHVQNIS